jgi:glucose/arabinose dehydrogenase
MCIRTNSAFTRAMLRALCAALLAASHAGAQQPISPADGRPPELAGSPLAPNPPGLLARPTAAIPLDKIELPPGFHIKLWAGGLANAREIALGSKGTVFVGSRLVGKVYAIVDRGDHREVTAIATGLHRPNGVAFKDGAL